MSKIRPGWTKSATSEVWTAFERRATVWQNKSRKAYHWFITTGERESEGMEPTIEAAMQTAEQVAKLFGLNVDEPEKTCEEHANEIAKKFQECPMKLHLRCDRPKYAVCVHNRYDHKQDEVAILFYRDKDTTEYTITDLLERYQSCDITVFKIAPGYPTLRICAEVLE